MRLLIKQRVFSWSDTYDIYDEQGNVRYYVKAEVFSLGHQIHIYNMNHNEIAVIREKLLTLTPQFTIESCGRFIGSIQKKFTLFRPQYEIDYNGWHVEGDFLGWNYDVYQAYNRILHITKEPLNWGDTYVVDIPNPADEISGIVLVIAIDAANCSNN